MGAEWRGIPEVRPDHRLVTYGPFAYVRHPIYTGIVSIFIGAAIYNGHWSNVLGCVGATTLFVYKLREEEVMLRHGFGTIYADYAKRTPQLIPFVSAASNP
eukprot:TRINITY_DN4217_c0_g1_i3.p2 TRINITY_DN4217_c0_g1~~TRINITY_DN4217_c0_g1_i3.p2  ORF type:complete len:101 (+),score=14.13 TRINITY_DN4217_c0_g1_i3:630-932(+)